jgi:hypothetical protein
MKVHFVTPTKLSILDISSMGDSSKRGDDTTIGQFDSGLKYAIALLLRDNVKIKIDIHNNGELENTFTFGQKNIEDSQTGKDKNLITIFDINGVETVTGFAFNLGYNWKNWMSYREIMSNVLDEKGFAYDSTQWKQFPDSIEYNGTNTVITLEFDESNEFFEVWQNRHLYMNFEEPLFKVSNSVECLENKENYLRIYKQNILVYEDKDRPSRFAWNIKFGDIDERRILNNVYSVEQSISYAIQDTDNEEFLRTIITKDFKTEEKEFLSSNCSYSDWISEVVKKITTEIYEEFGEVSSYNWLIDKVRKQKDCKIGGKKIKTIEDSLWSYSSEVTVETKPQTFSEPSIVVDEVEYVTPFALEIKKHYNFKLDVEIKIAKLKGSKVVADKYEKCLIIDENFDIQKDFHTFVVEYIDLTKTGNVVENLGKYICELIKK